VCLRVLRRGLEEAARSAVRGIDAVVRRLQGIHEYSGDPDCLLRLSLVRSRRRAVLVDGTEIREGHVIGDLHLWNERIPKMPPQGPTLSWAVTLRRRLERSLELLAQAVECDERYRTVRAFRAVGTFALKRGGGTPSPLGAASLAERLGFPARQPGRQPGR